ncbi:cellulose binding domain-containing protein, partial [Kitasatospora sp. NPDC058965]|uniref:GH12 family glycosyl hydrolase domain-containing protein n=1 Tax=Kitasatospora sp. NPDC058965 TaxID=3346682 RepID=UPI0036B855B2
MPTPPPLPRRTRHRARGRTGLAALLLAVGALLPTAVAAGPAAAAGTSVCTPQGTLPVNNGEYTLQANEWNSSAPQCVTATGGTAWSVSTASFNLSTSGAPATYPSLYKGCHWGACTTGSNLPIQVSNLGSATSSWSTEQPSSGAYDVAYDLWINSTPTTAGQPDGTEIMIWLNSRGGVQPFGGKTGTSTAAGHSWDVWTGQQTSWKIISYVYQGGTTSLTGLDVAALIRDAVARGEVNPQHYLIDAEAGFEIWQGGQGLATDAFSFAATAGGGSGGGDTTPPSTPAGLTVTGTTSSTASLSWTAATDNVGVTGYTVYRGGTQVGTTTGTAFTDTGLSPSSSYSYTVSAHDAAGNTSAVSAPVSATTAAGGGGGGGGGSGCTASYTVNQDWGTGFNATVAVTDSGTAPVNGWHVSWTWPGNQTIGNLWNGALTTSGSKVTVGSLSYNATLAPGAGTSFGFSAAYSGANTAPTLT